MKNLIERIEARLDDWGAKLEKKNIEYPVDLICGILFLVIGIVLLLDRKSTRLNSSHP